MAQEKGYDRGLISENNRASAGGGKPSAPKSKVTLFVVFVPFFPV